MPVEYILHGRILRRITNSGILAYRKRATPLSGFAF